MSSREGSHRIDLLLEIYISVATLTSIYKVNQARGPRVGGAYVLTNPPRLLHQRMEKEEMRMVKENVLRVNC